MVQVPPSIERTPIVDLYIQTVRMAKPPKGATPDEFSKWVEAQFLPVLLAVGMEQYDKQHGLKEEHVAPAGFVAGCVAAVLTAAIYHAVITPLLRTLKRYAWLLTASLACLLVASGYLWAVGDAASFVFFAAIFFPGVIGVGLTLAKGWKTYAEGRKALAEARKIENELSKA
jgi:hypothetical protein